ncbi:hypothetical protein C8Q73DRAFT_513703 [Cubamyces lactineus]|nr:hypothetical protein C8Q73DRAFT_513703 [Cubamyces lactineus]
MSECTVIMSPSSPMNARANQLLRASDTNPSAPSSSVLSTSSTNPQFRYIRTHVHRPHLPPGYRSLPCGTTGFFAVSSPIWSFGCSPLVPESFRYLRNLYSLPRPAQSASLFIASGGLDQRAPRFSGARYGDRCAGVHRDPRCSEPVQSSEPGVDALLLQRPCHCIRNCAAPYARAFRPTTIRCRRPTMFTATPYDIGPWPALRIRPGARADDLVCLAAVTPLSSAAPSDSRSVFAYRRVLVALSQSLRMYREQMKFGFAVCCLLCVLFPQ